ASSADVSELDQRPKALGVSGVSPDVCDVNEPPRFNEAPHWGIRIKPKDLLALPVVGKRRRDAIQCNRTEPIARGEPEHAERGSADPSCIFQHGLEDRLEFTRRRADDA